MKQSLLLAGALLATVPAVCGVSSATVGDELRKAYGALLDTRRCAIIIQAKDQRLSIFEELDRTDRIMIAAGAKGLATDLAKALAEWRAQDAVSDKICLHQSAGWHGNVAEDLRLANDALERAILRSSKG